MNKIGRIEIRIKLYDESETPATTERLAYISFPPLGAADTATRLLDLTEPLYFLLLDNLKQGLWEPQP